jgi:hypothetical protein
MKKRLVLYWVNGSEEEEACKFRLGSLCQKRFEPDLQLVRRVRRSHQNQVPPLGR